MTRERALPEARTFPESEQARRAYEVVKSLQMRLKERLEGVKGGEPFEPVDWLREEGRFGGGRRYAAVDTELLNRASINVSVVHYEDVPEKRLKSATALSTIIHPRDPRVPSIHMHISWTELRDAPSYWRIMADLNPSMPEEAQTRAFEARVEALAGELYEEGREQGERYFYIPVLERHRGVSHFYLEGYRTEDFEADLALARSFGEGVIDGYGQIVEEVLNRRAGVEVVTEEEWAEQLAYHTVYFFQVLTLDRGTTSGLLVHDQNDVGILASLPARIDRELLRSWVAKMPAPQDELLKSLVAALPEGHPSEVDDAVRARLAEVVREHYRRHPEALQMQASGGRIVPTVANHR